MNKNKTINVDVTFSELDQKIILNDSVDNDPDLSSLIYNVGLQIVTCAYVELKQEQLERFKQFRDPNVSK